jgi:hypothetical protein
MLPSNEWQPICKANVIVIIQELRGRFPYIHVAPEITSPELGALSHYLQHQAPGNPNRYWDRIQYFLLTLKEAYSYLSYDLKLQWDSYDSNQRPIELNSVCLRPIPDRFHRVPVI